MPVPLYTYYQAPHGKLIGEDESSGALAAAPRAGFPARDAPLHTSGPSSRWTEPTHSSVTWRFNRVTGVIGYPYRVCHGFTQQENIEVVEKIVDFCNILGREIATPDQARDVMGIELT